MEKKLMNKQIIEEVANLIAHGEGSLTEKLETYIKYNDDLSLGIISELSQISGNEIKGKRDYLFPRVTILHYYISSLRYDYERNNQKAIIQYKKLISHIKKELETANNSEFWYGLFNIFHEENLPIDEQTKDSFAKLMERETEFEVPGDPIKAIQMTIEDLRRNMPDATEYDLYEILASQLELMGEKILEVIIPALVMSDLDIAKNTSLLFLLHPNKIFRHNALMTLYAVFSKNKLNSKNFSRLIKIQKWWPFGEQPMLNQFIAHQKKLGAETEKTEKQNKYHLELTEIDGSGCHNFIFESQQDNNTYYFGGGILKKNVGLRDIWCTQLLRKKELNEFKNTVKKTCAELTYKTVDLDFLGKLVSHYIAVGHKNEETPTPSLLQISEFIGANNWEPRFIDFKKEFNDLWQNINLKKWTQDKIEDFIDESDFFYQRIPFSYSWFESGDAVDTLIKQNIKLLANYDEDEENYEQVFDTVFEKIFEPNRENWFERFILTALWLKNNQKDLDEHEKFIVLAKHIADSKPLQSMLFMHPVCDNTIAAGKRKFLYEHSN